MTDGSLVVIQGTPFCNIDCAYCYLPDRTVRRQMPVEILAATFRRAFESRMLRDPITFLWHSGEPLVVPIASYREAFELAGSINRQFERRYDFAVQTNGTLITSDWVDLFRHFHLRVGVSLDGPAFLHDLQRKDRAGRNTHERVMAGIRHLKNGAAPFSVIAVIGDRSLDHADAIFDFFADNEIFDVAFNAEAALGVHRFASSDLRERYQRFFARFLQRMTEGRFRFNVREISNAYLALTHWRPDAERPGRNSANVPYDIITVGCDGIYSTFCPELRGTQAPGYGDFAMGHVLHDPFDAMTDNPVFRQVNEEIRGGVAACEATCDHCFSCRGGSPSNKFFEHGRFDVTETSFCRHQKQAVVAALMNHIESQH
jgi:uncharacterized protein